jgi:hypothetical protein
MTTEIPWSIGVGLVLPERVTFDAAASTFTESSSTAGVPVPANASGLVVTAGGSAPTVPLQVRTQVGGLAGLDAGCSFAWREVGGSTYYGMDEPASVQDSRQLAGAYAASTTAATIADAVGLPDGAALVAVYRVAAIGPGDHRMEVSRIQPDGTTTTVTVFAFDSNPGLGQSAACQLQNGRVLLMSAIPDSGSSTVQVRTDYSDDGGVTWANATVAALPAALSQAGGDFAVYRMAAVAIDSTIALFITVTRASAAVSTYRDVVIQYVSRDGGSSFSEVFRTDETSTISGLPQMADCTASKTASANMVVAWVGEDGFIWRRILGSPYDPLDASPPTRVDALVASVGAGASLGAAGLAMTTAADGTLYLTTRTIASYEVSARLLMSTDGGQRWGPASVGVDGYGMFWRGSAAAVPLLLRLAPLAGRLLCAHGGPDAVTVATSAGYVLLGKTSDVTLPPYYSGSRRAEQVSWVRQWWLDDPDFWPHIAELPALPTATGAYGSAGWTITGAPGALYYAEDLTADATAAQVFGLGLIRRYTVAVSAGGSLTADEAAVRVRLNSGAGGEHVDISIRHTTTGFRVRDNIGAADIGTDVSGLTAGAEIEVMIVTAGQAVRVFYRLHSFSGEVRWTLSHSFTAAFSASATAIAAVQWGQIASSTTTSTWRWNGTAAGPWVGTGIPSPFANPLDLNGRPWSPRASVFTAAGTSLRALGVTVRGDEWRVENDSDTRIENGLAAGPRVGWEAAADTAQTLMFDLSSHNAITSGDLLIVSGFGANVGYIQVIGVAESGAETTLYDGALTTGIDGLHFSCNGDRVRPATATAGANAPTFAADELTGSQWSHYSGGAWRSFVISGNREGKWTNATTARTALFVDGALPTAGSGTDGRIVPRDWAVQVSMRGAEYERIKIVIPAPNTSTIPAPAGGRWKIGRLHIGYATAFVFLPSWGDRVTWEPVEDVVESRDGQRSGLELAPCRRRLSLGWVDGTITYTPTGRTAGRLDASPSYFRVESGADPYGLAGFEQLSLAAALRRTRGAREMVYLADMQPQQTFVYNRRDQVILCYLDSSVAYERFAGETVYGDAIRGDVVELVEAV